MKISCSMINLWHCSFSEMVLLYTDVLLTSLLPEQKILWAGFRDKGLPAVHTRKEDVSVKDSIFCWNSFYNQLRAGWQCGQEEPQNTEFNAMNSKDLGQKVLQWWAVEKPDDEWQVFAAVCKNMIQEKGILMWKMRGLETRATGNSAWSRVENKEEKWALR